MVIDLELKYISSVESSIKKAVSELGRRKSDYEGIVKDLNKVGSTTSNLSDCNIYLKKKNTQLQDKIDKLNSFKNKVSTFSSNAKAADGRVATYVTDESNTFYKTVGIKTGWAAGWESFKKGTKKVWKTVTDFYEKHKYVIDLLVDVALLAVAVVSLIAAIPTGGATLFFAGFTLASAIGDTTTSAIALGYHIAGDDEKAGAWAERGLKDGMQLLGSGLDWITEQVTGVQTDFFRNLGGFAYDAISIASVVYGLGKAGSSLYKSFKTAGGGWQGFKSGLKTITGLDITCQTTVVGSEGTIKGWLSISHYFGVNVRTAGRISLTCNWIKNIRQTYKSIDSLYKGTFLTDGIKIVKDIKGAWENLQDASRCAQMGDFDKYALILSY